MSTKVRVTAIIIFLNEARFIEEAIESVLAQDFEQWELILVDDGSTDDSTHIAKTHASRQSHRIRYLEHPGHENRGMSASRNLGLAHAQGDSVAFLDADDTWLPEKLSEQIAILDAHPQIDLVYGRTLLWRSWRAADNGHKDYQDDFCELCLPPDTIVSPPQLLVSLIENRAQTPTTCNALMRREAISRIGGFEPAFRGMFEDQVFFLKLSVSAHVFVASRVWARYRQRDDSCSARAEASGQVPEARRLLLDWLERHLSDRDVRTPEVWRMLRRQQRAARWPVLRWVYARYDGLRNALGSHAAR
jgi:glycosyltransferase involved in cell wall biosynthesis